MKIFFLGFFNGKLSVGGLLKEAILVSAMSCIVVALCLNCFYLGLALASRGYPGLLAMDFYNVIARELPHVLGPLATVVIMNFRIYRVYVRDTLCEIAPAQAQILSFVIGVIFHVWYLYFSAGARFFSWPWLMTDVLMVLTPLGSVFYARSVSTRSLPLGESGLDCLSDREQEIVVLVQKGLSNKLIADSLFISEHTVKTHLKNIYRKTGVSNRFGVMAMQQKVL